MAQIGYTNKVALNENPEILDINKITDDDMNEIKQVVNDNYNNTIQITDTEPTDSDNKIWIDTGEVSSSASEITNEYSTSTGLGYSCNYINGDVLYYDDNKVGSNTQIVLQQDISSYRYLEIFFKRTNETITGAGYNYNKVYNNGNNAVLSLSTRYVDTNKYYNTSSTYSINWTNGTITPVRQFNTTITISSSTTSYDSTTNDIYITRVIGYK